MNEYVIKYNEAPEAAREMTIKCNNWNYPYAPVMTARVSYLPHTGIVALLTCFEKEPMTRFTQNYDPVYTDSCMEIFLNVFPEKSNIYINVETNSNGAYIASFGEGRKDRVRILEKFGIGPEIKITKTDDTWQARVVIGNDVLLAVYPGLTLCRGDYMLGNIYKCGEHGENVHFLSLCPIDTPAPDFHRPEFFGKFILE